MKYNGKKLSNKDTQEILEELKNPKLTEQQREMFKKAAEIYQKHKKYELGHISDQEVEDRASLPDDMWIEIQPGTSVIDYYKHLLKNTVEKDKKAISSERKERLKNFTNDFKNGSKVDTGRLCREARGKECEENDEKSDDID